MYTYFDKNIYVDNSMSNHRFLERENKNARIPSINTSVINVLTKQFKMYT